MIGGLDGARCVARAGGAGGRRGRWARVALRRGTEQDAPRGTMSDTQPEVPLPSRDDAERLPGAIAAGWELVRPFTLVAPALGLVSGAVTAYGARPRFVHAQASLAAWAADVAVGALAAGVLNGASNALNQIYDLPIDRINKPSRPLPSGRISVRAALVLSVVLYAASLAAAATINASVFAMFALAALATVIYSAPPLRTKRFGWWANVTIAIPRGTLLKVAGWSVTKSILAPEAWLIGAVFGLFLLGATTSKDFADVTGDGANGCRTLPVVYGREKATRMIHPFFTLPFLMLAAGAAAGVFTGNRVVLDRARARLRRLGARRRADVAARSRRAGDGEPPELAPHVLLDVRAPGRVHGRLPGLSPRRAVLAPEGLVAGPEQAAGRPEAQEDGGREVDDGHLLPRRLRPEPRLEADPSTRRPRPARRWPRRTARDPSRRAGTAPRSTRASA